MARAPPPRRPLPRVTTAPSMRAIIAAWSGSITAPATAAARVAVRPSICAPSIPYGATRMPPLKKAA